MTLDNRSLLAKADLALADITGNNGLLQPAQAQRFIRLLIKGSKLLGMSTVTPLKSPKQLINKTRFTTRVLRAGAEGVPIATGDRAKPTLTNVEHTAQLVKAEVRLTNEVLEDNIEGQQLRDTIMSMLGDAISRDMEELVVQGDTTSLDTFLALFNGTLAGATSHVVNVGTVPINKGALRDMLKSMPSEFLRNKGALRFCTSVNAEIDYRDFLADRLTVLGDKALGAAIGDESMPVGYSGIPVIDVPMFPENLGGGTNCTDILLLDPKNIDVGIWRNIRIETDKDISEGIVKIVATMRFDAVYQEELAVVKATNVKVG